MNVKEWKVGTLNNKGRIGFTPVYQQEVVNGEPTDNIKCVGIRMRVGEEIYEFNYDNIFQFMYFTANEELRQNLLQKYERKVNYLPYDTSFKLSKEEMQSGSAKRRINLPVDEIIMAIARNEAWKLMPKVQMDVLKGIHPADILKGRPK
jgi:hypothetical protein